MPIDARPAIAFVVQRYGPDVVGGAEQLARAWAHLLSERASVTVLTTAAREERTWSDHYPLGTEMDGPVRVIRFPVERERGVYFARLHAMLQSSWELGQRQFPEALELEWMRAQGPWSDGLMQALVSHRADRFVFFSYLYPTTVFGVPSVKGRAFVVPTLHDEMPAYFSCVRSSIGRAAGRIWISRGERELGRRLWHQGGGPVLSMPLAESGPADQSPDGGPSRSEEQDPAASSDSGGGPLLLYCGRIDPGKGVRQLLEFHRRFSRLHSAPPRLVLTGRIAMRIPREPNVIVRGFVSEAEKRRLMRQADVFVMPSERESLSIALLEAMREGTPVLANGRSLVLRDHVTDSGAGATYTDFRSYADGLGALLADRERRLQMGRRGVEYARRLTDPASVARQLWTALELD